MPDPEQRLRCYDALSDGAPPAGDRVPGDQETAVAAVERTPHGKLIVRLDNGQVWSQVDSARLTLGSGDRVRIEAAASGSFLLEKLPASRRIRVRLVE